MSASLWFEKTIEDIVQKRVQKLSPPSATSYFSQRDTRLSDPRARFAMENLNFIHGNIGSLLTHISAMIASLGIILLVFEDSKITQIFIFLEMIIYTLLAVICVYCLRHNGGFVPSAIKKEDIGTIEQPYEIYLNKRYIYIFCSNGVLLNTFFFLVTLIAHAAALVFSF